VHTGIPHTAAFYGTTDTAEVTAWIVEIAQRFRRLAGFPEGAERVLNPGRQLTDEARLAILPHTPNLLMVTISEGYTYALPPPRSLCALGAFCPRLVELCLNVVAVRDADIAALALGCRRIVRFTCHDISLDGTSLLTNSAIFAMATQWTQLRRVDIAFSPPNRNICDDAIGALAEKCSGLRALLIRGVPRLTDISLLAIANGCPDMREITITHASVTDIGVSAIVRRCPKLTCVELSGSSVTDVTVIKLFADLSALHKVDLLMCDRLTDVSVAAVLAARGRGLRVIASGQGMSLHALGSIEAQVALYMYDE
jgi:hypothetical protein